MKMAYTYILTNKYHTVLYVGVTSCLEKRIYEHREGLQPGFTEKYNIKKLIYYETFDCMKDAISREKKLKSITRAKKIALINAQNPTWSDLGR